MHSLRPAPPERTSCTAQCPFAWSRPPSSVRRLRDALGNKELGDSGRVRGDEAPAVPGQGSPRHVHRAGTTCFGLLGELLLAVGRGMPACPGGRRNVLEAAALPLRRFCGRSHCATVMPPYFGLSCRVREVGRTPCLRCPTPTGCVASWTLRLLDASPTERPGRVAWVRLLAGWWVVPVARRAETSLLSWVGVQVHEAARSLPSGTGGTAGVGAPRQWGQDCFWQFGPSSTVDGTVDIAVDNFVDYSRAGDTPHPR